MLYIIYYLYRGYYMPARGYEFYLRVVNSISHEWAQRTSEMSSWTREDKIHTHKLVCNILFIIQNTSEIPNQLAFKGAIFYVIITTVISSQVKITCYLHVWRYEVSAGKLTWYFTDVYIISINIIVLLWNLSHQERNMGLANIVSKHTSVETQCWWWLKVTSFVLRKVIISSGADPNSRLDW